jgi:hypothetical protein
MAGASALTTTIGVAFGVDVAHAATMLDHAATTTQPAMVHNLRTLLALTFLLLTPLSTSCAHDTPATTPARVAADPLPGVPAVTLRPVDAPGFNVEDLTARLRDGFVFASGIGAVSDFDVRAEIAACIEMPCATTMQDRLREAEFVVAASVSKIGGTVLGTARLSRGLAEVGRVSAQGPHAGSVTEELGRRAGAAMRDALMHRAPSSADAPVVEEK